MVNCVNHGKCIFKLHLSSRLTVTFTPRAWVSLWKPAQAESASCSLSPECSGELMKGTGSSNFEKEGICFEKCGNLWRWLTLWKATFDKIWDFTFHNTCCTLLHMTVQQGGITFKRNLFCLLKMQVALYFPFYLKSFLVKWHTLFSCILISQAKPSCSQHKNQRR